MILERAIFVSHVYFLQEQKRNSFEMEANASYSCPFSSTLYESLVYYTELKLFFVMP